MRRRSFIESLLASSGIWLLQNKLGLCKNETDYWQEVRNSFPISKTDRINLNNGSCGMIPDVTERYLIECLKLMNEMPPYEQDQIWKKNREESISKLSKLIGAESEEIALTRNTTESLQWIIDSVPLEKGSEVVCAFHDYTLAKNALVKKCEETGANLKKLEIKMPSNEKEILEAYQEIITDNCSLLHLTAMTHRSGQKMPIQKLVQMAHEKGALVVVDAAHSFGNYTHDVKLWGCDFYATSLHKWFNGPRGTGLIYIKKEHIPKIKGPLAADHDKSASSMKFEFIGTRAFYIEAALSSAIEYNETIGVDNKYRHLGSLTQYWTHNLSDIPNVEVVKSKENGPFGNIYFKNTYGGKIKKKLKSKNIFVKTIDRFDSKYTGIRVTPGIYTNYEDLDQFIDAIKKIAEE